MQGFAQVIICNWLALCVAITTQMPISASATAATVTAAPAAAVTGLVVQSRKHVRERAPRTPPASQRARSLLKGRSCCSAKQICASVVTHRQTLTSLIMFILAIAIVVSACVAIVTHVHAVAAVAVLPLLLLLPLPEARSLPAWVSDHRSASGVAVLMLLLLLFEMA
jgi:hypothetical protein